MSAQASSKKRKHLDNPENPAESSSKRSKKDHDISKDKKNKKGKSKSSPDGEFKVVKASLVVSIPPVFANDLTAAS